MKRILALLTATILLFSCSACAGGGSRKHNEIIVSAVDELKAHWKTLYDASSRHTDRYFEIKNTRVITLKGNDVERFSDVAYLIEFVLYTDYMGSSPYYEYTDQANTVIVYKSGYMEVANMNPIKTHRFNTFDYDISGYIKAIDDYHDKYNSAEYLK